jgi:hypothetical protein
VTPAQAVFRQLSEDFPPQAVRWVSSPHVTWKGPYKIPLGQVDTSKMAYWKAARNTAKLALFRKKITGGDQKPVVLIKVPGARKLQVADGHHRTIASHQLNVPVQAFVGTTDTVKGPWDVMHAMQRASGVDTAKTGKPSSLELATPQQPPEQPQQPQQDGHPLLDAAAIAAVLAILLHGHSADEVASQLPTAIPWVSQVNPQAAGMAIQQVMNWPPTPVSGIGTASTAIIRSNDDSRAAYLAASLWRIRKAQIEARSRNADPDAAAIDTARQEQNYQAQHVRATALRLQAAGRVDGAAMTYGDLLGWYSTPDRNCTPECRDADGKNFRASRPPLIGYPGTTHANCRCAPGKPFAGAPELPS